MRKGRISLSIAIVLLILALIVTTVGVLNVLGVLSDFPFIADFISIATIYVGISPDSKGFVAFGILLLALSIILLAFRQRKPYSMFFPIFLCGIYFTIEIYIRLIRAVYVPEALFVTLRTRDNNIFLFLVLIVVEIALSIVLLIPTAKLDQRWRRKKEILRKKLESEGVLMSKEETLAEREKARIDRDTSYSAKKERKEAAKLEKDRLKAEKKEQKRLEKEQLKENKSYEKSREDIERKKELQEEKELERIRKEKDRKAYRESLEEDKKQSQLRKEEKKRLKEQKRLEKEKKRQGEELEPYEIPAGPANPNRPLEFPEFPDLGTLPEFEADDSAIDGNVDIEPDNTIYDDGNKLDEDAARFISEPPKYNLSKKRYTAGGMLEATLEMMNTTPNEVEAPQRAIIGYDDTEDKEEIPVQEEPFVQAPIINMPHREERSINSESHESIAPSNLPPSHPRYKMFESLQKAPVVDNTKNIEALRKEEQSKIAPSNLSPSHPRYKMFESLQSDHGANSVSHYPSKAFEPEVESTPTMGVKRISPEDYKPNIPKPVANPYQSNPQPKANIVEEPEIQKEERKPEEPMAYEQPRPVYEQPKTYEQPKPAYAETANDNANSVDSDDIPEQTDSLDLSVGIGGLVSNNAGYGAIMKRGRQLYTAPPVTLLKDYPGISSEIDEFTQRQGEIIVETYAQQRTIVQLSNIIKGPTVTMYELTIDSGTLLKRVTSMENEINYALGGKHVRILAPIPGKRAVGVEVPNEKTSVVGFKDMIYALRANEKYMSLKVPMILGKTITGEPIVIDVAKMPHMVIAGTTGSGKSVCINAFINTLIYQKSPADVRLVLVDPKVVELSLYNGIPHLLTPVITEAKKVVKMLNFLVEEMERRYKMLSSRGVRNIEGYNQKLRDEHIAAEKMPYIVLIMDEFADMMSVVGKEIETQIARLAAKARAAGIHLILATQRPSSDVITGTIKSNLPARIAFAVSSGINSRVILDEGGAENLLGKGDMLLMDPSSMGLKRIQGAFLSDGEVESIVAFAKTNGGEPDYLDDAIFEDDEERHSDDDFGDGPIGDEDSDEVLFEQAKQIAYEKKSVSASYLQRRMKIGYNRAARLIEMMEEKGIVGPPNGSKPREILKFE